ncbi:MAG: 50S ribosomal protein L6 [bacterium]|nr:50S ribosomal protein L6 [bacterium]
MSRIGKKPIPLPKGVDVKITETMVTVKGPLGTLQRKLPEKVAVNIENGEINITRDGESKTAKSMHGLTRTLISNMVTGVSTGFVRNLEIVGVGYKAEKKGPDLVLSLGYSHPIEFVAPEGITIEAPKPTQIVVKGYDKELLGVVAAMIRGFRKPEPYKGKGIKYENEVILRKAGKTGKGK